MWIKFESETMKLSSKDLIHLFNLICSIVFTYLNCHKFQYQVIYYLGKNIFRYMLKKLILVKASWTSMVEQQVNQNIVKYTLTALSQKPTVVDKLFY